jgi:hypothetical protein
MNRPYCTGCDSWLKMQSGPGRRTTFQVIANVYVDGRWVRVEHYHPDCYEAAGQPHGPAKET